MLLPQLSKGFSPIPTELLNIVAYVLKQKHIKSVLFCFNGTAYETHKVGFSSQSNITPQQQILKHSEINLNYFPQTRNRYFFQKKKKSAHCEQRQA